MSEVEENRGQLGAIASDGRSVPTADHHGVAPDADLIIVKLTSEGAPEHGDQPSEREFNGCITYALRWLDSKLAKSGQPAVALINSGVQLWGPADGTSAVSRAIDGFIDHKPGRIFVIPSGDEGGLLTHAGGTYSSAATTISLWRDLSRSAATTTDLAMWFKGPTVAVTVQFDDDQQPVTVSTDPPQDLDDHNGIRLTAYRLGDELDPRISTSGHHFVNLRLAGHAHAGHISLTGLAPEPGRFDMYSDPGSVTTFADHIVPGRLTDYASTKSAIIVAAYVSTNKWTDIDGREQGDPHDLVGHLWSHSAGGPTRDGRLGVDIAAPGQNVFGTYARHSIYGTNRDWLIQDGQGLYGLQTATSGAAPVVAGAIALMLEMKPDLTSDQVRDLLHQTAVSDANTGTIPKNEWGYGKINVRAAIDRLCELYHPQTCHR